MSKTDEIHFFHRQGRAPQLPSVYAKPPLLPLQPLLVSSFPFLAPLPAWLLPVDAVDSARLLPIDSAPKGTFLERTAAGLFAPGLAGIRVALRIFNNFPNHTHPHGHVGL